MHSLEALAPLGNMDCVVFPKGLCDAMRDCAPVSEQCSAADSKVLAWPTPLFCITERLFEVFQTLAAVDGGRGASDAVTVLAEPHGCCAPCQEPVLWWLHLGQRTVTLEAASLLQGSQGWC